MAGLDEFSLIAHHFAPLAASEPGAFDLTDDAAVLAIAAGHEVVVTADALIADVHFLSADPPESVGAKVLAVNISDLAAMGAAPRAYVLTAAFPRTWPMDQLDRWLVGFTTGLRAMQEDYGIVLAGGDTVATPGPLALSVTAFGTVEPGCALRRSGARPGDAVYVSGIIGDGVLGLGALGFGALGQGAKANHVAGLPDELIAPAITRYRTPRPRVALGRALAGVAGGCADVSDGLIADLGHICRASGVYAIIEAKRVPFSPAGRALLAADADLLPVLLTGGDDYELVFTASSDQASAVEDAARKAGVRVHAIGRIEAPALGGPSGGCPVAVQDANGEPVAVERGGWSHF
ncbi:MAG: thiamine-phosphate kinase [Rhodospirillales bacterium]|nr:thiamine-phosphate kinase [Rhodospirillales bacterium]